MPAARGSDSLDLCWSPRARFVLIDRRAVLQDRIDDSPRLLDVVLPRKQRGVAMHGVTEDSFVRVHLVGAGKTAAEHLRGCAECLLSRRDDIRANRDRDVGTDPEPAIIRLEVEVAKHGRWLPKPGDDLSARHGQMLAGPDVKGHTLPAPGIDPQT